MSTVAQGAFVGINGIDLSLILKSVKPAGQADVHDRTALGDTAARKFQKGLIERSVSAQGFFKSSAVTAEDANGLLQTALSNTNSDHLMLFGRDGSAVGALAEMMNLKVAKYDIDSSVGELIMAAVEAKATKTDSADNFQIGVFIFNQTVTGSTNGTAYDSTTGGAGYFIQIHVLAGDDDADVTIQHSTNGTVWVDLIAATAYAANTATQVKSTVTSVNRYVRAVVVPEGTTNTVAIGMKIGYSG